MINRWILTGCLMTLWTTSTGVAGIDECSQDSHCDDENPCTRDRCILANPRTCRNTPLSDGTACSDGSACTTLDHCSNGVCIGTPRNCDDENVCTVDSCNPATGACSHVTPPFLCFDNNLCTTDSCNPSTGCVHTPRVCGSQCTISSCNFGTGICFPPTPRPDGTVCNDGMACTTNDLCSNGTCSGTSNCNDGNVCTTDTCTLLNGCVFTDNIAACDDDDACTTNDACSEGSCVGGPAPDCNDDNGCTDDFCDPSSGCVHEQFGLDQWLQFMSCYDGVGVEVEVGCECFNLDVDGDVDLLDVAEFVLLFDGG